MVDMSGADVELPEGLRPPSVNAEFNVDMNLWLTKGSMQSGLHYDEQYNSLTVLQGTKRVFLFPPSESKHLYHVKDYMQDKE